MSNSNVLNSSAINFQCSTLETNTQFTEYLFTAYILTSILNGISSITAITGNAVVILVVWKTRELHTPSNVLLSCLALSDLTVGLIAQPSFVIHKIGELNNSLSMYCTTRILTESLGCITAGTSVLTMTGISIEEGGKGFMRDTMENEIEILSSAAHVNVKVLVSFFLCESSGSAATQAIHKKFNVPIDASHKDLHNFTKHVVAFTDLKQIAPTKGLGQNPENRFLLQISSSTKRGRRNHKRRHAQHAHLCKSNGRRRRLISSSYLKFPKILNKTKGYTVEVKTAHLYASSLMFLNSSFNPAVYWWRIKNMRTAAKDVCLKCLGVKRESVKGKTAFQ
ncbi:uncharacterized protein [Montipora capricornis]|uniref:uncharacterized protein n=1 Tax=Montipora capricornis TaxID=246305 RepID=UPI0035F2137C